MSTIKVNGIRGVGASTDAISVNNTDGTCTAKITNNLSNRNLIINGAMQVAQRGTSSTTSGYGTVDRFTCQYGGQDEVLTQEQVSLTSSDTGPWEKGFRKAFKITNGNQSSGAGGDDYAQTIYHFEGQDINTSGWDFADPNSKITVSFWAKSSVAQTFNLRFRAYATAQQEYYTSFALSANTWTKVTKTIPGHADLAGIPSDNGGQLFMVFQYYYGTNLTGTQTENAWHAKDTANTYPDMTTTWWTTNDATFHLTGVQLEVGDTATDFEHRSYADELMRCYRYFYMHASGADHAWANIGMLAANTASNEVCIVPFPNRMRTTPSLYKVVGTDYFRCQRNNGYQDSDDVSYDAGGSIAGYLYFTDDIASSGGMAGFARIANKSAARIGFDAEL